MPREVSAQDRRREQLIEMRDVLRNRMIATGEHAPSDAALRGIVQELKLTNAELEGLGGDIKDPLDELAAARAAREAG